MVEYSKVVHFNLFMPTNAIFKQFKSARAEIQIITCSNTSNCQLITRHKCACRHGLFGGSCPYGKRKTMYGFTPRAQKYRSWCSEQKEKFAGVGFLGVPKKFGAVGEYIFLPYPHMDMLKSVPWEHGRFIKKENFTTDTIIDLITFHPRAMFGGEIVSYQKEVPPLFLKHLSEQMPVLLTDVTQKSEFAAKRFIEFTNIGRKAILETTTPNVGKFIDIHGGTWTWDGETLVSENSRASYLLVKFKKLSVIPEEKQVVGITDEGQVNSGTVFVE